MIKKIEEGIYPSDIKKMNREEMELLSYAIRDKLISTVAETGGHLASNLGIVELTIAVHKVFDTPRDKIIWDVGHQSYVHKLLTGRGAEFGTLRQMDGLSGFPKRCESVYDTFDTGHASNSISAALGMAAARDLKGEDYAVVAVIGDGALTGGMVYEALNNAGTMDTSLIILLNDNEMSISPSEGSMAQHLGKLRSSERYNNLKQNLKKSLKSIPVVGDTIFGGLEVLRDAVKYTMVPGVLFEELGFVYLGPIDGHDLGELVEVFTYAKMLNKPVIVHCVTKKGKGYQPAEKNPSKFHGISPFDTETGTLKKKPQRLSYSGIFGRKLLEIARKNPDVIAVTAAMTDGTGLKEFSESLPRRLFDVGIAEEHAVTFAAGAAANGLHPAVAIYSTFLQRAYDQIIVDVCMQKLPVTLCIDRAGIVGADGETHHGVFDISYLMPVPNLVFFAPSDRRELEEMLEYAMNLDAPCAVRYPRGEAPESLAAGSVGSEGGSESVSGNNSQHRQENRSENGREDGSDSSLPASSFLRSRTLAEGRDVTLISVGKMTEICMESCRLLQSGGISAELIDARVLRPFDREAFVRSARKTGLVFVAEDNVLAGGFGSYIEDLFARNPGVKVYRIAWPDEFIAHGTPKQLMEKYGMDASSVAERVREAVEGKA